MQVFHIDTRALRETAPRLHAGDRVYLKGTVYTARDAAHMEIARLLDTGGAPPFELRDAVVYYAGPTPARPGEVIGSCGPTTSGRLDAFTPRLHDLGMLATVGKGPRSEAVRASIIKNRALYLLATGGAGALISKHITACREIAFPQLGCESVKRLEVDELPLFVGIDVYGKCVYDRE